MMKKLLLVLLVAALFLTSAMPAMADLVDASLLPACYRYVTPGEAVMFKSSSMPVFESSSAASTVTGSVSGGEPVTVMSLSAYRDWAFIVSASVPGGGWIPTSVLVNSSLFQYNAVVVSSKPGNRVNLREGPSTSAKSIGKYHTGTLLTVLSDTPADNNYYLVQIGDMVGYMSGNFFVRSLVNSWSEMPTVIAGTMSATQHPLYSLPGSQQIVGYVPSAAAVTVLGVRTDGWYHVMYQGVVGFIRTSSLMQTLNQGSDTPNSNTSASSDPAQQMINKLLNSDNRLFVLSSATGRRVNLRTKPSASAPILIRYYTGTPVYVIDEGQDQYLHVRIGYMEGYMDVEFLSENAYTRNADIHGSTVSASTGHGNVYQWNDSAAAVSDVLPNGTTVVVLGYDDDWAHVYYGNAQHGYMNRADLNPAP